MSSSAPGPTHCASLDPDLLRQLTTLLGKATANGASCVFGVEPSDPHRPTSGAANKPRIAIGDGDFRLHMKPTDDLLGNLIGFTAPEGWAAVGVATGATMRHLDSPDLARRCTLTHTLSRSGYSVSVLLPERDASGEPTYLESDDPVLGMTSEACRRVLGLATPPPGVPVRAALAWLWMDAVVEAATRRPGLSLQDCWLLHPAVPRARPGDPTTLAARCMQATEQIDWSTLRQQVIDGDDLVGLGPHVAAWCDEGSFSRLVLAQLPEARDLLEALRQLVPMSVLDQLLEALATELDQTG